MNSDIGFSCLLKATLLDQCKFMMIFFRGKGGWGMGWEELLSAKDSIPFDAVV